jgi:hypothetical protein
MRMPFAPIASGDLGEIRVLEIDAERHHAGFLHLDTDEVQRFIVEDDLDNRRLSLHLCQQIPERRAW